jgi:hypothetical protein
VTRLPRSGAALALLFAILTWPAILAGGGATSEAADQAAVHLPLIRRMASGWPALDLARFPAATGPGYHVALAAVARAVSPDERVLRLAGSLFALLLLAVAWRTAARVAGDARAARLVLPLLGSTYYLGAAIWLTTDDAALAFAALAAGGPLTLPPTAGRVARWGLWGACAVLVRQVHVWTAVPAALAAFRLRPRSARASAAAAAVLAPAVVLAFLVSRWGGLVPPGFAEFHAGGNAAAVLLALALCGAYGPFFLPAAGVSLRAAVRPDRAGAAAAAAGVAIAVLLPSSYDMDAGRWGGPLWKVLGRTAVVADRSLPVALLAVAGAVALARLGGAAIAAGRCREALVLASAGAAWIAAQSMNAQAFQRYLEPPVLIGLAWLAALAPRPPGRAAEAGPVLLALLLLAGSVASIYRPVLAALR